MQLIRRIFKRDQLPAQEGFVLKVTNVEKPRFVFGSRLGHKTVNAIEYEFVLESAKRSQKELVGQGVVKNMPALPPP